MKRAFLLLAAALFIASCNQSTTQSTESADKLAEITAMRSEISTPDEAIAALVAGNKRYMADDMVSPNANTQRRTETLNSQAPFAAVVACSDSRVPVELIFDQGIGDIFVIRTAGNSVNNVSVMGSIDYAIDHLNVPVVVVMGHQNCGGVTSAIAAHGDHAKHNGQIGELLHMIQHDVADYVGKPELLDEAIHTNTTAQVAYLTAVDYIAEKIKSGKLKVIMAHYNLDSGEVEFAE